MKDKPDTMGQETDPAQGVLYLCATPIGNMEDITLRVLRILKEADMIAAEDTRQTRKILARYDINNKLISYNEHNRATKEPYILDQLRAGKSVALTSDAGTPGISDPGAGLATAAIREGISVVSLPGPSALIVALTSSGLNTESFIFAGFLPRKKIKREELLKDLAGMKHTLIFYEAPHRLMQTLQDMERLLGDRSTAVCRELTKKFEEIKRGRIHDILGTLKNHPPRGEYTIVVEGASDAQEQEHLDSRFESSPEEIHQLLSDSLQRGMSRKDAVREVAAKTQLKKREIYAICIAMTGESADE